MKISVILCTFNRSQYLGRALDSLSKLILPESVGWEVLVVDNNSTDDTRQVAERFCSQDGAHFRYFFEGKSGKSNALNRGILEAAGEVLAFTDDDATVEPAWLHNLTAHLGNGEWAGAAGRILPEPPFQTPSWLLTDWPHALAPLAIFDPKLDAGPLDVPPYGVNMAFHRRVFETHGRFRTDLGPGVKKGAPQKNEDSEFGQRLLAAGERLRYEPSAILYHAVPPSRVQKSYFLSWWFDKGRADCIAFGNPCDTRWIVFGIPLRLLVRAGRWSVQWMLTIEPTRRFDHKMKLWMNCGKIKECYLQSRRSLASVKG